MKRTILRWQRAWILSSSGRWWASAALLAVVTLHLLGALPFQDTLRTQSFDLYQTMMPRPRESAPAIIVDVDEESLARFGQWPWPRSLLAQLLDKVWAHEPAAVAVDIVMPERDRLSACDLSRHLPDIEPALAGHLCGLPGNDALLARALQRGPTVLGIAGLEGSSSTVPRAAPMRVIGEDPQDRMRRFDGAMTNLPELDAAAAGHAILSADLQQGVVRRVPMVANVGGIVMPSLPLELLRLATGSPSFTVKAGSGRIEGVAVADVFVPTQPDGSIWVNYGRHDNARFVSAAAVLDGRVDPELMHRKLVLVGVTGLGLVDLQSTSLGERIPGVEIHAQVIESIFDGNTLLRPHWGLGLEGGLMLAGGLAIAWGFPRMRARTLLPAMVAATLMLWSAGLVAFAYGHLLLDAASPTSILFVMFSFMLADTLVREELRRRALESDLRIQREQAARARGEMEAARRIQVGILPDLRAQLSHEPRLDVAACMEPARQVGGDLYDCFMLDEHRVLFSVGDVCGKGVPSSLFMVISKTLCKSLALREGSIASDAGALMTLTNREIARDNPEMLFVTAFIGVLDLRTGELAYCNAGHDPPLVFAPGGPLRALEARTSPALCFVDDFDYPTFRQQLGAGEFLCLYTDGVTEAFDRSGEVFGQARLDDVLGAVAASARAQDVVDAVRERVRAFEAGGEPSDDLTVMALRWRGAAGATVTGGAAPA